MKNIFRKNLQMTANSPIISAYGLTFKSVFSDKSLSIFMRLIEKKFLWLFLGLTAILPVGCAGTPVSLDTPKHDELLKQDMALNKDASNQQIIKLSIQEAIQRGYEKNLDAKVAALEALSQQDNITLAQLRILPNVEVSGGYAGRSNAGASSSESILTNQQSLEPSKSTERDRDTATLEANWNLLDVALALADMAKAKDEAGVAKERHIKVIQNVERDIYTAYWRAVAYRESRDKNAELLSAARKHMEKMDYAAKNKLLSADQAADKIAQLSDRLRNLQDMNDKLQFADIELKSLLSLPVESDLILTTRPTDISEKVSRMTNTDVSAQEWQALQTRPEMREEILKKNITIRDTRREIYQTFPGINLLFSREYDSNKYLVDQTWSNYTAQIAQTITGLITLPDRYNAAKNKEAVADARRQALSSAIVAQVHMGRMRLSSLSENNKLSKISKNAASRKSHAIAGKKAQGFSSGQDSFIAQVDLQIETMRASMAYADLQDAYAAMKNTIGQPVIDNLQSIKMAGGAK